MLVVSLRTGGLPAAPGALGSGPAMVASSALGWATAAAQASSTASTTLPVKARMMQSGPRWLRAQLPQIVGLGPFVHLGAFQPRNGCGAEMGVVPPRPCPVFEFLRSMAYLCKALPSQGL